MHIAHRVQQPTHLPLTGRHDARIRVARRRDAERRRQVQILASLRVPDMHAARPLPHHRPRAVGIEEGHVPRLVSAELDEGGGGAGHGGKGEK